MAGPMILDMPKIAPNSPMNLARCSGGYRSAMMPIALVNSAAPPMPFTARKITSWCMPSPSSGKVPNSPLMPHNAEPNRKMLMPITRISLHP